jgi:hypothetical protein
VSHVDAQKAVPRILYMLGEGLDRDKLNALLHDGTLALKLQANCGTFGAEMDLMRCLRLKSSPAGRLRRTSQSTTYSSVGAPRKSSCDSSLEWIAGTACRRHSDVSGSRTFAGLAHPGDGLSIPHATASPKCVLTPQSPPLHSTATAFFVLRFVCAFACFSCA